MWLIHFIFTDLGPIAKVLLGDAIEEEAGPDEEEDHDRPVYE